MKIEPFFTPETVKQMHQHFAVTFQSQWWAVADKRPNPEYITHKWLTAAPGKPPAFRSFDIPSKIWIMLLLTENCQVISEHKGKCQLLALLRSRAAAQWAHRAKPGWVRVGRLLVNTALAEWSPQVTSTTAQKWNCLFKPRGTHRSLI